MRFFKLAKERLRGISGAVVRFWTVFIMLCAAALFIGISIENGGDYENLILSLVFAAFVMFFAHTAAERFGKQFLTRVLILTAGLLFSGGCYAWLTLGDPSDEVAYVTVFTLCFALLFAAMFVQAWQRETPFSAIFLNFFKSVYTSGFFSGVIFGGICIILLTVDLLLFDIDGEIYAHLANIVWVIWAPMLMLSLLPKFADRTEDRGKIERATSYPRFFEILLLYVLSPLAAAYTLVLVIYMVKTVATGSWEDNLLEPLILIYLIALILLNVLLRGIDKPLSRVFRRITPGFIAAIAVFGMASTIVTINREGLVAGRYYILLFGLYSVIVGLLMLLLSRRRYDYVAALAVAFALVCTLPGVGAYDVSAASKARVITETLGKYGMLSDGKLIPGDKPSDADKRLIYDAVSYLDRTGRLDKLGFLPENFDVNSANSFMKTFGFDPYGGSPDTESRFRTFEVESGVIRTGGYDYMLKTNYFDGDERIVGRVTHEGVEYTIKISKSNNKSVLSIKGDKDLLEFDLGVPFGIINGYDYDESYNLLSPDKLTFDAENSSASLRVVFTRISLDDYGTGMYVEADMTILFSIK